MNIAMFVETYEPSMNDNKRQILIVPVDGTTHVYTRITDGTAGKGNRWEATPLSDIFNDMSPNEYITTKPVGIYVTPADEEAIRNSGWSPVLSTKAMSAYDKAEADSEFGGVRERIESIFNRVSENDTTLDEYVSDLRRQRQEAETSAFIAPTQTTAESEQTEEAPASSGKLRIALATIPPVELADRYVNRKLTGNVLDFSLFDYARANKREVLIYGPTGPGKTTSVVAWAARNSLRLAAVSGNAALEPSQLIGKYVPDGNGGQIGRAHV